MYTYFFGYIFINFPNIKVINKVKTLREIIYITPPHLHIKCFTIALSRHDVSHVTPGFLMFMGLKNIVRKPLCDIYVGLNMTHSGLNGRFGRVYVKHAVISVKLVIWGSGTKYSPGRRHNRCDLNKKRMRQKNQEVANINLSDFWIYTHLSYKKYNGNSVINNIN